MLQQRLVRLTVLVDYSYNEGIYIYSVLFAYAGTTSAIIIDVYNLQFTAVYQ